MSKFVVTLAYSMDIFCEDLGKIIEMNSTHPKLPPAKNLTLSAESEEIGGIITETIRGQQKMKMKQYENDQLRGGKTVAYHHNAFQK